MMRPYTAVNLKEDAKNRKMKLSDYASKLTGSLGVSHLVALSQNGSRIFVRMARTPAGPTLGFHVRKFSLMKDVVKSQKRPYTNPNIYSSPAVVVTNNFGDSTAPPHVKLMRITFQAMFPAINVATVRLVDCRRVVMFNLTRRAKKDPSDHGKSSTKEKTLKRSTKQGDEESNNNETEFEDVVEIRHYAIKAAPIGVDRKVRKLVQTNVPNLSRCEDISDYILGNAPAVRDGGITSDSEAEDEISHVVLPQKYTGKGNNQSQKSALKLVELGPRLCLHLVKVEKGLASGDVMYHSYVQKSPEEVRELKAKAEKAVILKQQRRQQQEKNVAKKKAAKKDAKISREKSEDIEGMDSEGESRGSMSDQESMDGFESEG
jgi:ribosome biogenesis protein SSF1/2